MKLSILLAKEMEANNPSCQLPPNYSSWCDTFQLMMDGDKRNFADVEDMILFSQYDDFWKTVILSPGKLRKNYDQLILKREKECKKHG